MSTLSQQSNIHAFLLMIQRCEGTYGPNAYRTLFGGKTFMGTDVHPNIRVPFGTSFSTAAGAYQILNRTWKECAKALDLKDFSPRSQDLAAVYLIKRRGALLDVISGNFEAAINKCRKEWASLPGAGYGQPEKKLATAKQYFLEAGGVMAA